MLASKMIVSIERCLLEVGSVIASWHLILLSLAIIYEINFVVAADHIVIQLNILVNVANRVQALQAFYHLYAELNYVFSR